MSSGGITCAGPAASAAPARTRWSTPAAVDAALRHLETHRIHGLPDERHIAQQLASAAIRLGRMDLNMRAELVVADTYFRDGTVERAALIAGDISPAAERMDHAFIAARSHFLLALTAHASGDASGAKIHGVESVEQLPSDAPIPIQIDHLTALAIVMGPGPDTDRHTAHALDLAALSGDTERSIDLHNTIAYHAWQAGDAATASEHVSVMRELSQVRGIELTASALDTLARVHGMHGEIAEAIETLEPLLARAADVLDPARGPADLPRDPKPYGLPEALRTLAELRHATGDLAAAHAALDLAVPLARRRKLKITVARLYLQQAQVHAAAGDFERAYERHQAAHAEFDALHSLGQEMRARILLASFAAREAHRDREQYEAMALHDSLTGLPNRRRTEQYVTSCAAEAAADRRPLSVAIVDADLFKRVNDDHSHAVGDAVLAHLADIFTDHVDYTGHGEMIGRIGGEEFVYVLPRAGVDRARRRCEKLRRAIADEPWGRFGDGLTVTVSIGLATAPAGNASPGSLLAAADRHLYIAKNEGRNRVDAGLV